MAVYAVGDVQGCLEPLRNVLDQAGFDPARDRLWLVGDLVNRGPDSLGTLRFVRALGEAAITVLGNHDLHLLAILLGGHQARRKDTFEEILAAPDLEALTAWLRSRPLIHFDADSDTVLVHAGLPHVLDLHSCLQLAAEVEQCLRGDDAAAFLQVMYGNEPPGWRAGLVGHDRLRMAVNYFTRMRFIDADGDLDFAAKEGLDACPAGFFPWFERRHPDLAGRRILFGHWAALEGVGTPPGIVGLDTGCVWGRCLTLLRLDDGARFTCDCGAGA